MPARKLPARPDLDQYRKQAKELVKAVRAAASGAANAADVADDAALMRVKEHHPRPGGAFALADAQHVIAREHGFESWPKFVREIERLTGADRARIASEEHFP